MIKLIEGHYNNFINKTFHNKESIKNYFLNHERRQVMFKNLEKELKNAEFIIFKSRLTNQEQKRMVVKGIVDDFTRMFCVKALEEKEKQIGVSNGSKDKMSTSQIITG